MALILLGIGGVFLLLDFRVRGLGSVGLDVLNDALGYVLILMSTSILVKQSGNKFYGLQMAVVRVLVALSLIWSVLRQAAPGLLQSVLAQLIAGLGIVGAIMFCFALRNLLKSHSMHRAARSWTFTGTLIGLVWGGAQLATVIMLIARGAVYDPSPDLPLILEVPSGPHEVPLLLVTLLILVVPIVALGISIRNSLKDLRGLPTDVASLS